MIRIHAAGLSSTVQDAGRYGHLRSGLPEAGPADPFAFAAARALAALLHAEAIIEIVGFPFAFACDDRRIIAVTGREVGLRGHSSLPTWTAVLARPGQELVVLGTARSRFAYLAVSGGLDLPLVLGSRATHLPSGTGAVPRVLLPGDAFPLGSRSRPASEAGARIRPPSYEGPVRAMAGPHARRFSSAALDTFFSATFRVAESSDRMGVRLEGPRITSEGGELLTCGIPSGAVQIPSGGAPIVLLADHQTTGGYPVIATVVRADQGRVAQAVPGEELHFVSVTRDAAVALLAEERTRLAPLV